MKRKMVLEDDVKEFWGFYLLRGSRVRISTCSRQGSLLLISVVDKLKQILMNRGRVKTEIKMIPVNNVDSTSVT